MTYKLEPWLERITSPITLFFPDGKSKSYKDGSELIRTIFDCRFIVRKISAKENSVEVFLTTIDEVEPSFD